MQKDRSMSFIFATWTVWIIGRSNRKRKARNQNPKIETLTEDGAKESLPFNENSFFWIFPSDSYCHSEAIQAVSLLRVKGDKPNNKIDVLGARSLLALDEAYLL